MARKITRNAKKSIRKRDAHNIRLIKMLVSLLFVAAAFLAGFALRGNDVVVDRLGLDDSSADSSQNPGLTVSGNTYDSLSARVAEIQGILSSESLDTYSLDTATENVLKALADSTDDSYLRYYDEPHYSAYLKEMSATYAGVGILFAESDGQAYAVDIFSGSEAEAAGVQTGDFVVAIDGDRGTDGWTAAEVVKQVSRDKGSSVVLTFRRPASLDAEGGDEFTVTLTCSDYSEPNVTTELVDGVGYIKLAQITQNADTLVETAINSLAAEGAKSFVLDLRDNPGGYLTQAVDIASLFVGSGTIVNIQTKASTSTRTATGSVATTLPLVVLVNGNTASTSEVIAGALQDTDRAVIVGERTMGKGSVQSVVELSFGGALRYTSAYYSTPKGYAIDSSGISPDVVVTDNASEDGDEQLNLALETARSLETV